MQSSNGRCLNNVDQGACWRETMASRVDAVAKQAGVLECSAVAIPVLARLTEHQSPEVFGGTNKVAVVDACS